MENVETVEVTATGNPLNSNALLPPTEDSEQASDATQRRFEEQVEVHNLWKAKGERAAQQQNLHYDADSKVFVEAELAIELTPSEKLEISKMKDEDLHNAVVAARNVSLYLCAKAQAQARQRLIPLCEEMRKRFKRPGLKNRPFGLPTVEDYFKVVGLNYNTVRSWCAREKWSDREKLKTAFFMTPTYTPRFPMISVDNTPYARSGPDFEKIRKLAEKIVAIAQGHDINLRPAATDLLIIAGRQFATKGEADSLDPAAALKCVGRNWSQ